MLDYAALETLIAFAITLLFIFGIYPLAIKIGLTDKPDRRKQHNGAIPLVGGLAAYLAVFACLFVFNCASQLTSYYLAATGLIVLSGLLDDRFHLPAGLRAGIEVIAASIMIFGGELWISNLGNLMGLGEVRLPFWIGYPFTVVAVFGIINAINMLDGLDGLAGGIGTMILVVLLFLTDNSPTLSTIGTFLVGALCAFLLCNYQAHRLLPKVFLGDAGSKLIGLTLVWVVIEAAQSGGDKHHGLNPVTALFIVGLPLMDMVTTTLRRIKKGLHPFSADRTHIHHIFERAGFSKLQTVITIHTLALLILLTGLVLQYLQVPEVIQFCVFLGLYFVYANSIMHAWKLSKILKINPDAQADLST